MRCENFINGFLDGHFRMETVLSDFSQSLIGSLPKNGNKINQKSCYVESARLQSQSHAKLTCSFAERMKRWVTVLQQSTTKFKTSPH